jgi:dTDP-4-dehydrorhamnose 3,5-epimerase
VRFVPTSLAGAFIIEPEPFTDDRGVFARTFCAREFEQHGLATTFVQCSTSWNARKGTVRGLHYQLAPACEVKIVRCTSGSLFDVVVDLRPDSPTYLHHISVKLSAANRRSLYIPAMFAHGFQTLEDGAEIAYQMSEFYAPELGTGLRWNDPTLGINWPLEVTAISEKDESWALLS